MRNKSRRATEFGDFQTPTYLARRVCELLLRRGVNPASILEPTCGAGSFLIAALDHFAGARRIVGLDLNTTYISAVRSTLQSRPDGKKVQTIEGDFFKTDWPALLASLPDPLLVIGNPPWVTNAGLGALGSSNLPRKTNFHNRSGLDALTGKANFDISEWMLLQMLEWLNGRNATMAMLCKTVVARKVLEHAWRHEVGLGSAEMYLIDAKSSFGASVDACLLVCTFSDSASSRDSTVYGNIAAESPAGTIGYREGHLIADVSAYQRWKHLQAEEAYPWRSGIKHDCAKVMELYKEGDRYRNGFHELAELEGEHVYPMLKGSDVARGRTETPKRWMLVTQRHVGDDTATIRDRSPKTWEYLQSHADRLNRRGSSIYRKRPPFSIFGVGEYAFAPWKIAISGLHKKLEFVPVGSFAGKPVVLDDTCYFLPCETEQDAREIVRLLNSSTAREFFSAFIFWDAKRPVTAEVLRRLDLMALARELGREDVIAEFSSRGADRAAVTDTPRLVQRSLFGPD